MKRNSLIQFAAVAGLLAVSGASAFAQSLKADVPFAFATPAGGQIPAGKIEVTDTNSSSAVSAYSLWHVATGKRVIAVAPLSLSRPRNKKAEDAVLLFQCTEGSCALAGIYKSGEQVGHGMRIRTKPATAPATQVAEVWIPLAE